MIDKLIIGGHEFRSRFILGSGKFSLEMTDAVIKNGGVEMATLAIRRANVGGEENILDYMPQGITLLPNTSGARNAQEAVRIARLARELGCGDFVKIEVVHDSKYLLPDNYETIKATEILAKEGFVVMPYMYPDLNAARDMVTPGQRLLCLWEHLLEAIRGSVPESLSRFWWRKSSFLLLWTPVLGAPPRHVRLWSWELPQLWPIRLSPLPAMLR